MIVLSHYQEQWKHANIVVIPKKCKFFSARKPIANLPQLLWANPLKMAFKSSSIPGRNSES